MKLIMGLEYRSKIRRNASCSPWHARATRSAELFIRDPANAPGCPSRLNSWASRFIVFRCVSEPPLPKVSDFSTRQSRKSPENAITRTVRVDRIVSKQQFGNRTSALAVVPKDPGLRQTHWTEPQMVAEVAFTEWTSDGSIRHPSFQGLRGDKTPKEVVRELPSDAVRRRRAET